MSVDEAYDEGRGGRLRNVCGILPMTNVVTMPLLACLPWLVAAHSFTGRYAPTLRVSSRACVGVCARV